MINRVRFAFDTNQMYPSTLRSYSELLDHPVSKDVEYRKSVTNASVLYPVVAHLAAILGDDDLFNSVGSLQQDFLSHSNFQLWFPDDATEDNLYSNHDFHGIAFTDLSLQDGPAALLAMIAGECDHFPQFGGLSCVQHGLWPLALVACRHFRLPVPPQLLQAYATRVVGHAVSENSHEDLTSHGIAVE